MDRVQFLQLPEAISFTDWLSEHLSARPIQLDIAPSKFVPQGLQVQTTFGELIPQCYRWRATGMASGDWGESSVKTQSLSFALRAGVQAGDAAATLAACHAILLWGGERNQAVGARPFLRSLGKDIAAYIAQADTEMSLARGNLQTGFPSVRIMNSMLTKVHAFYSSEGLPIYDSRVSAAAATLVEYWRSASQVAHLPEALRFPLAGGSAKKQHKLGCLFSQPALPGQLLYTSAETPARWASAKLRLAWLMAETLRKAPALFAAQSDRMRAFEAALFMVGYDIRSLRA